MIATHRCRITAQFPSLKRNDQSIVSLHIWIRCLCDSGWPLLCIMVQTWLTLDNNLNDHLHHWEGHYLSLSLIMFLEEFTWESGRLPGEIPPSMWTASLNILGFSGEQILKEISIFYWELEQGVGGWPPVSSVGYQNSRSPPFEP